MSEYSFTCPICELKARAATAGIDKVLLAALIIGDDASHPFANLCAEHGALVDDAIGFMSGVDATRKADA